MTWRDLRQKTELEELSFVIKQSWDTLDGSAIHTSAERTMLDVA